jgi:hypothetical protein
MMLIPFPALLCCSGFIFLWPFENECYVNFVYVLQQKYLKLQGKENNVKKGVVFATYSSLIGECQAQVKYRTRLKQLLKWCGKDFDGVVSFSQRLS